MKLRVIEWEQVQRKLPQDDEGNRLWRQIEDRTFGKQYQAEIGIAFNEKDNRVIHDIIFDLEEVLFNGSGRYRESREEVLNRVREAIARRTGVRKASTPRHGNQGI